MLEEEEIESTHHTIRLSLYTLRLTKLFERRQKKNSRSDDAYRGDMYLTKNLRLLLMRAWTRDDDDIKISFVHAHVPPAISNSFI